MTQFEPAAGFADFSNDFEIPVITISASTPFERGLQHGSQAKAQIDLSVEYYARLFEIKHSVTWAKVAERAMLWEKPIVEYDSDLFEEIRGIAKGSSRSVGEILALNARGEMVYSGFLESDGCTAFALMQDGSASGHTFAGQNWDWRIGTAGSRIIVRIEQPPKPTLSMMVEAGQLGRHGANSEGVGIFANGLPASRTQIGLPQAVIRRHVLDQANYEKALDVVLKTQTQIPANVILAHQDFAIDVEMTPDERRWRHAENGIITHANHFEYFRGPEYTPGRVGGGSTLYRGYLLRQGLSRAAGVTSPGSVREIVASSLSNQFGHPNALATHPEPDAPRHTQWGTLVSSIVDLTSGHWYMADGAPDVRPYRKLPWNIFDRQI